MIKALRTEHEVYVEYRSGPRELYDLRTDPYQLQNMYATADPAHIADLSQRLAELAVPAAPGIPGDFNFDGFVDAADYVTWRKTDGTPAGYNVWRTHFGQPAGRRRGCRCKCHSS